MAYAAVPSLSQTIDILLTYHQHYISPRFKDQILSLHKRAIFFQSFLEDFPDRGNNWEETIREVTDRAEDIIELLLSDSLLESTVGSSSRSKSQKGKYQLHYGLDELEGVSQEMKSVTDRVKGIHTEAMGVSDEELMKIISRLRGGSSALEILPIVGIGGIGKTTLARNTYNHPMIVEHFDIRAWSTISINRSLLEIISDVLLSMNKMRAASVSNSEDEMIRSLDSILCGRRFLIILDDVWSPDALGRLKSIIPDDRNGSRIILTTRSFELAMSAGHIHEISLLDEDQTWNLFRQKIFNGDPCPSQLHYVGKMIARNCRGHRLSIEVVSGILAADKTLATWEDVSENLKIASDDVDLPLEILSQSYRYLPHHLMPCFLYLGIFPKYHEIHVSKLTKLWVAEGFLNESECKSFEELGELVEDLVRRSLVTVCKRKCNGRIKSITVHDLMWEVCLRQAEKDNFILHIGIFHKFPMSRELKLCRRVSDIIYDDDFLEGVYGSTIRSIMLNYGSQLGVKFMAGNVRLLRILDSSNAYYYDLPEEVFELFHLRYLAFHFEFSISEAISKLENLQTLIIYQRKNCGMLDKLPKGIWRMPQLRHLVLFRSELPSQEGATSALENLQTLSGVVDFKCLRENLKIIPNLKKLAMVYTKNSRDVLQDQELHNLVYLHKLEILKIEMDWSFEQVHKMSRCAFPPTLKKLNLCGLQLPWEDMKSVASLPNLQVLKLRKHACIGETWETSEGGFAQLTYLLIEESNLVHWITKSSHCPRLERLVLNNCQRMIRIPHDIGEIETLELIEVDGWNKTLLQSARKIQQHRHNLGNDPIQISVKEEIWEDKPLLYLEKGGFYLRLF